MIIAVIIPGSLKGSEIKGAVIALFGKQHLVRVAHGADAAVMLRITMCEGDAPENMPDALQRVAGEIHQLLDKSYEIVGEVCNLRGVQSWLAAEHGFN